ncbi:MAG: ClpXP protease specificity-enhancing factor [Burkholderiaceae bacterium]
MSELSTKPYLVRAIHEWCTDSGYTPYVAVHVDETVRVPPEFVKNGEIVLNVSGLATQTLQIDNEGISLRARFGGVPRDIWVPIANVMAIYARENGQGMAFELSSPEEANDADRVAEADDTGEPLRSIGSPALSLAPPPPAAPADEPTPPDEPPPRTDRPRLTRIK